MISEVLTVGAVTIEVPLDELRRILELAQEATDEIEAEASARYPSRIEQPVQQRRFDRDMALPNNLRALIGQLRTANPNLIW